MSAPVFEPWTEAQRSAIDLKRQDLVNILQNLGDTAAIWFRVRHYLTREQVDIIQSVAVASNKAYKIIESLESRDGGWQGILAFLNEHGNRILKAELERLEQSNAATASATKPHGTSGATNKAVPINQPESTTDGPPHTKMSAKELRAIYQRSRNTLLDFVDVATVARYMGSLAERVRHSLSSESSSMSRMERVDKLLTQIGRSDEALEEFAAVLYQKQRNVYDTLFSKKIDFNPISSTTTKPHATTGAMNESVFQVIAKFVQLDGVPYESTGCGTLVEILVAGEPLCGILAAFSVFSYQEKYSLILVTLGALGCDTRNFKFEVPNGQYIFACELLGCSFLQLNEKQIEFLKSMQCRFLRVDRDPATYNGYYKTSIFAVTVRQNKLFRSESSDLAAAGCQLFFAAWTSLCAGSPVLKLNKDPSGQLEPPTVIALHSPGSSHSPGFSHSYFSTTATQCGYIVVALQRDMEYNKYNNKNTTNASNITYYPRAMNLLDRNLLKELQKIDLRCVCPDHRNFEIKIKEYNKIHLLAVCRVFSSQNENSTVDSLHNPTDSSLEDFMKKMATSVISGMRHMLKESYTLFALCLQNGFTQSICESPKNLADYMLSLIDNLIVSYGQQCDNLLVDQLNTISTCLKSHCSIKNCKSWMTDVPSIWQLVSNLEQQLSALESTNAIRLSSINEFMLKSGILLVSVVVFLQKARLVVNLIRPDTDWKVKILECVELRRTHHQWFWRVRFKFSSDSQQEAVQDVIGPWNQGDLEMDDEIWHEIHKKLQEVFDVIATEDKN